MPPKKPKQNWGCDRGCDVSTSICPHIEARLSEELTPTHISVVSRSNNMNKINSAVAPESDADVYSGPDFYTILDTVGYKLTALERRVIIMRYMDQYTYDDISKRLKLSHPQYVFRLEKSALAKIKEAYNE